MPKYRRREKRDKNENEDEGPKEPKIEYQQAHELPLCRCIGCNKQTNTMFNDSPYCMAHFPKAGGEDTITIIELEPRVQIEYGVPRSERCQVPNCGHEAEFVCVESRLRYCRFHKHPHKGFKDEPHTYRKFKT